MQDELDLMLKKAKDLGQIKNKSEIKNMENTVSKCLVQFVPVCIQESLSKSPVHQIDLWTQYGSRFDEVISNLTLCDEHQKNISIL